MTTIGSTAGSKVCARVFIVCAFVRVCRSLCVYVSVRRLYSVYEPEIFTRKSGGNGIDIRTGKEEGYAENEGEGRTK